EIAGTELSATSSAVGSDSGVAASAAGAPAAASATGSGAAGGAAAGVMGSQRSVIALEAAGASACACAEAGSPADVTGGGDTAGFWASPIGAGATAGAGGTTGVLSRAASAIVAGMPTRGAST